MRKWLLIIAGAALLLSGVALLWPGTEPGPQPESPPAPTLPELERVEVISASSQGLSLTGRVLDPLGKPVPGAEVSLVSSAQASLSTVRCGECGELLLSCSARETALVVSELLRQGRGLLAAAATTRADGEGRFRFERLIGVSFTVWARADGLGEGVRERAAPGEPVELYLPALRAIAGLVQDEEGRLLAGARVRAVSRRLALPAEGVTDAAGRFELRGLGEGPFYVLAEADEYLPAAQGEVEAGPQPIRLTLAAARRLEVSVRHRGQPVEATVRISADHLSREVTAAGGEARFARLYPDRLMVTARHRELSSPAHAVTLEQPLTRVTLELESGGRLLVTVVDEAGQPVPEPELFLSTPAGEVIERRKVRTGELAMFGPLAEGPLVLRGGAEGYKPSELPVAIREGESAVELVLSRGVLISGRVLDEYGRAAPGISILVTPTGDSVLADGQGRFSAQVPSPGLYQLHAHHSDWGGGTAKVTAPASGVELQLEPRAGVQVTVLAEGRRVEGANAVLFVENEGSFRSDRPSGSDGVVLMRGMPAGSYWLLATHPEFLPSERQRVTIGDGQLLRATAELRPGARVVGEVVDASGAPVSGVSLTVIPRGAEPAVSDGMGRFEFRALRPSMTYRVEAKHPRFEQQERVMAVAGGPPAKVVLVRRSLFRGRVLGESGRPLHRFRVDDHTVDSADGRFELPLSSAENRVIFAIEAAGYEPLMVDRPATPDLGDFTLRRAPEFSGIVRDDGGAPVADAVVSCDVCDESVLSGPDGRFHLSSPPYVVSYVVTARKGRLSGSRQVSGGAGAIEVRISPAVRLAGVAYLPDRRPAAGVEIEGLSLERSEPLTVVTGPDGSFAIDLPEGSYRFVHADGERRRGPDALAIFTEVRAPGGQLTFGPAPGTASLTVRVTPRPGYGLWVVRGDVGAVGNPPVELLRSSYAQLLYQPAREVVTFEGLLPGRYTLVWGSFHVETPGGPLLRRVDVPLSGEVTLKP